MMMSNAFYSNTPQDSNKQQQQQQVQNAPGQTQTVNSANANSLANNLNQNTFQNQFNYAALTAAAVAAVGVNLNQPNTRGNITPPNTNLSNGANTTNPSGTINLPPNLLNQLNAANSANLASSQSPNRQNQTPFLFRNNSTTATTQQQQQQQQQLSNMLQQQKKLVGQQNLLNLNTTSSNNLLNSNLLNSTISRPQQQLQPNSQLSGTDLAFSTLDPSDFPVLHRTTHSPFQTQQQQQQAQLQQLQQQLRSSSFNQNAPASAPILSSQSAQNLILQFANSVSSSSSSNLANSANAANMLMMMNSQTNNSNNNSTTNSYTNYLLQQHQANNSYNNNQIGSGKMWSNFNSNKDMRLGKSQQSAADSQHQEFQIQQEDFPALPRPQSVQNKSDSQTNLNSNTDPSLKSSSSNLADSNLNSPNSVILNTNTTNGNATTGNKPLNPSTNQTNSLNSLNSTNSSNNNINSNQSIKKGIIISPDGRIKNVPPNMLLDQFGLVGLLAYLRSAEKEKDIFTLALGTDLTALGLNLNSNENLYHSFLSPFSDVPCRLQDIDFPVPTEYIINFQIKDKLAPIDISRYHEDTLFYLFYMNGGDLIQLQAAAALFDHDWRYHTEKRVWLTKVPGMEPLQKDQNFERGIYTLFDVSQWRKVQMEMSIEYSKLAEKPQLPAQFLLQSAAQQAQNSNPAASLLPAVLQQQLQQQAFTSSLNPNTSAGLASIAAAGTNSARSY